MHDTVYRKDVAAKAAKAAEAEAAAEVAAQAKAAAQAHAEAKAAAKQAETVRAKHEAAATAKKSSSIAPATAAARVTDEFAGMQWKERRSEAVTRLKLAVTADNHLKRSTNDNPPVENTITAYLLAETALKATLEAGLVGLPQSSRDKLASKLTMVQQRIAELDAALPQNESGADDKEAAAEAAAEVVEEAARVAAAKAKQVCDSMTGSTLVGLTDCVTHCLLHGHRRRIFTILGGSWSVS